MRRTGSRKKGRLPQKAGTEMRSLAIPGYENSTGVFATWAYLILVKITGIGERFAEVNTEMVGETQVLLDC
jgi:hypothetical protein